jgi:hypothetical protein
MIKSSQIAATLLLLLPIPAIPAALAQALPAASASPISTGFALPSAAGTLQYAVSASESISSNNFGSSGVSDFSNLSGDLAFITGNQLNPFSTIFSGGRAWSSSGQSSYYFLNLSLNQVIRAKRWTYVVSDSVNYLPQTPSTGLSGVPGVGDLGVNPAQTGVNPAPVASVNPGQGVLTGFSTRVANSSTLSVERQLTGKTSLQAAGSYALTRFLSDATTSSPGLDSDSESGNFTLDHRIDARNSLDGNFTYSHNNFTGNNSGIPEPSFSSQTASLQYTRQLTRKLVASLAAGPQWTSNDSPSGTPMLSLYANVSAGYTGEFSRAMLAYSRSSNSGYGVVGGAISDSVSFSTSRTFDRVWFCALSSAYTRTTELPAAGSLPFTFHTTVTSVQMSRAIARSFSAYASYTLEDQSNQGAAVAVDLYSGLSNVAGFGLTYSPAALHLGHS